MSKVVKPMLGSHESPEIDKIPFPVYASPKMDGVRALVKDGKLLSRKFKPFPNAHVNKLFARKDYSGLDGELVVGPVTAKDVFRVTSGACRREEGEPDVKLHVFDSWSRRGSFRDWYHSTRARLPHTVVVEQTLVKSAVELMQFESDCLTAGYEGVILRAPDAPYKFGRSTLKEFGLVKLKRFVDEEFEILGIVEEETNQNEAKKDAFGRTERSSSKAGKVPTGRMGTLIARYSGVDFGIGSGFTFADREWWWKQRSKDLKEFDLGPSRVLAWKPKARILAKVKYFPVGMMDRPRFPVYLGVRDGYDT